MEGKKGGGGKNVACVKRKSNCAAKISLQSLM
jgi:hypothetical protein